MIIYLDTSALLKQYIGEQGAEEVKQLLRKASGVGTAVLTKTEIASAMSRAVRGGIISPEAGQDAWGEFLKDWPFLTRLLISTRLVEHSASLAWQHRLRAYDAIHLAAALLWQERLNMPVTLATFDRNLWLAGREAGMSVWPEGLVA
ncbi:MAG: type II toxin-antitoxin system VapC family toxin [Chloroflexi bacterium]|nr:type II toxin-antitoxin system VapC family toxin [Chloroflexota bacterium]